jgi:predicted AAA+ superfamily ATPase
MKITRLFNLTNLFSKSFFLLGPRQTGKSWLIDDLIAECPPGSTTSVSLLNSQDFTRLSRDPSLIRRELTQETRYLFVDEVQLLPVLLNEIQLILSLGKIRCCLSGSSARKLKRGGINLLGGRATIRNLHPLVSAELNQHFDLHRSLRFGTLPSTYWSDDPNKDLADYVALYLTQEIAQERATRNVPAFSRFLEHAALRNGEIINFTNVANDAQVAPSTVRDYYSILEDTLVARELPAWRGTIKRKATSMGKYYFFDIGVVRAIVGRNELHENSKEFGDALEAFIHHELRSYIDYRLESRGTLHYWRSESKFEVDFILNEEIAIEVKAAKVVGKDHLKGLRALKEENLMREYILVACVERPSETDDGIKVFPVTQFLQWLWD